MNDQPTPNRAQWKYVPSAYAEQLGADISTVGDDAPAVEAVAVGLRIGHERPRALTEVVASPPAWMRHAECVNRPEVDFFKTTHIPAAKRACGRCFARQDCLTFALGAGIHHGVYGGTTGDERREMLSSSARRVGFVYGAVFGGSFKVGFSAAPAKRFAALVNQSGLPLEREVFVVPGTMADELSLHHRLAPWRVSGEWYRLEAIPSALAAVANVEVAA